LENVLTINQNIISTQNGRVSIGFRQLDFDVYEKKDEAAYIDHYISEEPLGISSENVNAVYHNMFDDSTYRQIPIRRNGLDNIKAPDANSNYLTTFILNDQQEVVDFLQKELTFNVVSPTSDGNIPKSDSLSISKSVTGDELRITYDISGISNTEVSYYSAHFSQQPLDKNSVINEEEYIVHPLKGNQIYTFNPLSYYAGYQGPEAAPLYTLILLYDSEYKVIGYYEKEFSVEVFN
jgi:hypothetical protein